MEQIKLQPLVLCQCPECQKYMADIEEYGEPEHTPDEARHIFKAMAEEASNDLNA